MIERNKKKDIKQLIECYALNDDQLYEVIPPFVYAALGSRGSKISSDEIIKVTIEHILKNNFIEKYIPAFNEMFTHSEIKFLIDCYTSVIMRKFLRAKDLFIPMFQEFNSIIIDTIEKRERNCKKV